MLIQMSCHNQKMQRSDLFSVGVASSILLAGAGGVDVMVQTIRQNYDLGKKNLLSMNEQCIRMGLVKTCQTCWKRISTV